MASVNYNVNVNTAQGVQALQQLQAKLGQTNNAFESLKGAIAGVVTAGFISSLYRMANELTDMAAATGLSTQSILGFTKAVSANGGSMEGATNGVAKFVQAIDSAANGSKEAQDTFLKLGVSLNDLRTLSEEDLLKKAVAGFNEGTVASERLALAVTLFGKTARSWDMSKINSELTTYIAKSKESASAVQAAGDASQNFSNAYKELSIQILSALEPLSRLANGIMESTSFVKEFVRLAVEIGGVVLAFTALGKVWSWGGALLAGLSTAFKAIMGPIAGATGAATGFGAIIMAILKNVPAIAAVALAVGVLFGQVKTGLEEMFPSLKKDTDESKNNADAKDSQGQKIREVTDALSKEKAALDSMLESFNRANAAANDKILNDTKLINLGEQSRLGYEKELEAYNRYITEYNKLNSQFEEKSRSTSPSDQAMTGQIAATMNKLTEAYKANTGVIQENVAAYVQAQQAKQLDLFNTKALIDSQNQLRTIQDDIAKSTMSEIERKYYDIDAAARASAKSAIEAEEARRNAKMPIEEQQQYYAAAAQGNEQLKAAAEEQYKNSRKWNTGWTNAFNEYRDNATNAALEAQRVFNIAAQGMEDALMNFIKRGKFEWKNFVQLMVDELLRSQIRQLIGNLGSGMQSASSGIAGGIGKLLGFASGGIIPTNGPVIVGERGPELLMGAAGMNVVPNNALGGASNVVYNISAVDAMSFKAMIARDPTFLYAVTEQGRRSLPGGR